MNNKIAVLSGDGIGPEVTKWGVKILEYIGERFDVKFEFDYGLIGHAAIEATGDPLPEDTLLKCRDAKAVLLGAVGHPMYDNNPGLKVRPEQGLLRIRKALGLYTNIRPIKIFDELIDASSLKREILEGADILFYRELTGGIYFGERGRTPDGQKAFDTMEYSRLEVERIAEKAFEAAMKRNKKLHSVDKANVLESSRLWREIVQEMSSKYPEVEVVHMFIDNAAMQLIRDPKQFDVVLTGNMFGDILTDEASQISGSLGMLPSASVGNEIGLFEPIHGSAPDIAGMNIANPMATILSCALLLDIAFEMKDEADCIIKAVDDVLLDGYRTRDIADENTPKSKILGTNEIGKQILQALEARLNQSVVI
jgi:3-isopropylmalate dehydrogenase